MRLRYSKRIVLTILFVGIWDEIAQDHIGVTN